MRRTRRTMRTTMPWDDAIGFETFFTFRSAARSSSLSSCNANSTPNT